MGEAAFSSIYGCTADVGLTASAQPKPLEAQQPPFCPLSQEARWSSRSLVTKLQFMCVSNQTRFCTLGRDTAATLVTQPMLQLRPNRTELRSMDSYIQILCRFQKRK